MLLFADGFLNELDQSRLCWIGGALSYGKTRLAVDIYLDKYSNDYDLVTNFKSVLSRNYYEGLHEIDFHPEHGLLGLFVVIDEGGRYMRNYKVIDPIAFAAAKLDCYVLMPGRRAPHVDLLELAVTPFLSTKKLLGFDFITVWRYSVDERKKSYQGVFWQVFPQAIHGIYNTLDPSYTPWDLLNYFKQKTKEFAEREGIYSGSVEEFTSSENMADAYTAIFAKERFTVPLPVPESKKKGK